MSSSLQDVLWWIIVATIAFPEARRLYRWRKQAATRKIDRLLDKARAASGREADKLYAGLCEACARRIQRKPGDAHALHQWGIALWWCAAKASGAEADRLYEEADRKFAQSQANSPNNGPICSDRAEALRRRAALHTGEECRRLLIRACEECEKRVGIYSSGPTDARVFQTWGRALWWLAAMETGAEAKRLYQEADDKFTRGCTLAPDQAEIAVDRADALVYAAALYAGEQQRDMALRACRQCEQLAGRGAGGARMLVIWGSALCWLGAASKGSEADSFYTEAGKKTSRALAIAPDTANAALGVVRALVARALLQDGETRRNLLTQVCEECERLAGGRTQDAGLLGLWAEALCRLGPMAAGAEADARLATAGEKYASALTITPGDSRLVLGLVYALLSRAVLHPGEEGRAWLIRACEECERLAGRNPQDIHPLGAWASALCWLGRRTPDSEADRLFATAEEKCTLALAISPDDEQLLNHMGRALTWRAELRSGADGNQFLARAESWFETAVRDNPDYYCRFPFWADVLYLRAERMPGEETRRVIAEAVGRFEIAAQSVIDPDLILKSWGVLLMAQARCAEGVESIRLLRQAKSKLAEADSRLPGFGAYELACVCARLGEPAECKSWLEKSHEPGIRIRPARMATQRELESVRDCDWFRRLVIEQ